MASKACSANRCGQRPKKGTNQTSRSKPKAAPTAVLTDVLLQILQLPQTLNEAIFAEQSVAERARKALAAHERFPHSPPPST